MYMFSVYSRCVVCVRDRGSPTQRVWDRHCTSLIERITINARHYRPKWQANNHHTMCHSQ